jgi:hypothetical protein
VGAPHSKANNFNSCVATLRQMVGEEPFARVVAALPSETQALVHKPPLPTTWIATQHLACVIETAGRELFSSDEERVVDWARQAVGRDLRTVYKVFIRFLSPTFVIERAARVWSTYTQDNGTMRASVVGERLCEVYYDGLASEVVSPLYWAWQRGTIAAAADASGVKDVRVATARGGGRERDCVLRVSWR